MKKIIIGISLFISLVVICNNPNILKSETEVNEIYYNSLTECLNEINEDKDNYSDGDINNIVDFCMDNAYYKATGKTDKQHVSGL